MTKEKLEGAGKDEWHKVADGDLPKENEYIMIYSKLTDNIAVGKRRCAGKIRKRCVYEWYFATYEGTYCLKDKDIIAWKEIVLPKEELKMEFDKSRVFTALNADELKVGSKVICADDLCTLKSCVDNELYISTLREILPEDCMLRFRTKEGEECSLVYLVEPPEEKKLKVSDLKLGDIVRRKVGKLEYLVTGIDHRENEVFFGDDWSDDEELGKYWEKVEK